MSLAQPASEEKAFKDVRRMFMSGRRLLVSAGLLALAFCFAIILIVYYGTGHDASLGFLVGDYVVTLGIAVPGLTIYILRQYTERSIRRGNAKVFSKTAKLGLVSISWFVLVIVVILLVV